MPTKLGVFIYYQNSKTVQYLSDHKEAIRLFIMDSTIVYSRKLYDV